MGSVKNNKIVTQINYRHERNVHDDAVMLYSFAATQFYSGLNLPLGPS